MAVIVRLAAAAPIPVFLARGGGSGVAALRLAADPRIDLVASPRHATVLLVVGSVPLDLLPALAQVHDQLPRPRATVWWTPDRGHGAHGHALLADARHVDAVADEAGTIEVLSALRTVHAGLVADPHGGEDEVLAATNPTAWRGTGDTGTGGEGMMGGVPYGRPMAMTAPDRDGLELDELDLVAGPFLPGFPPGLSLAIGLQGDVLSRVEVRDNPFVGEFLGTGFAPIASIPTARLARAAEVLLLVGLDALATRAARLALSPTVAGVQRLRRTLRRTRAIDGATAGVGVDAAGTDARGRVTAWLAEAEATLQAGTPTTAGAVQDAHGHTGGATDLDVLVDLLTGMEWGEAVITLATLDLDLERVVGEVV